MPNTLRILLIEDSPTDSELLIRHLKKADVNPQIARVETLPALKTALKETPWDAIICDYNLPQFNALDAIAVVRELTTDIPCIVVSGSIGEEKAIETMKAGASDYIMKDNLTRLVPVLQRELKEAQARRERRSIAETLKKSEDNLRQAQKLESIGQLAGGIAHDFNNLLATILIQAEVLENGLDADLSAQRIIDHVRKGLEQITKSAERATNLTRQLLAFSRRQIVQSKVMNVNLLVRDMQEMLRRVIEENIELQAELATDLKNVKIDPVHLEQIILNLTVNSRDAMPNGGILKIETRNQEIDALTAKRNNVEPGAYIVVTVSDTGSGMSDEVKKHLFEPFYTTKPIGKGTGLGLCTIYGIVQQNRGFILVESEMNKGTKFYLYFPVTREEAHQANATIKVVESFKGTETVLIVEDETDFRNLVCETLKTYGYQVLTAKNGVEALDCIKSSRSNVDLIITDVVMPNMGGPELSKQIKNLGKDIKFIFQSGYTQDHTLQDNNGNLLNFLSKPYSLKILLSEMRKILD
jgi:two-component system cell cycle sensor histidine kinase/response regulator CckA